MRAAHRTRATVPPLDAPWAGLRTRLRDRGDPSAFRWMIVWLLSSADDQSVDFIIV